MKRGQCGKKMQDEGLGKKMVLLKSLMLKMSIVQLWRQAVTEPLTQIFPTKDAKILT